METRDILFIVLAVSAAVLTGLLVWLLYYVIAIVRDLRKTSREIHEKVKEVGTILDAIRQRIGDTAATLTLLTQVVAKVADRWRQRGKKRSSPSSTEE